jgi:hypothetical protein
VLLEVLNQSMPMSVSFETAQSPRTAANLSCINSKCGLPETSG